MTPTASAAAPESLPAAPVPAGNLPTRRLGAGQLVVLGVHDHLADDHAALLDAATQSGFVPRFVDVSELGLVVGPTPTVTVAGAALVPDVVLPRGVNRPWAFVRQVLLVWEAAGVTVVPSVAAADVCADKLVSSAALAQAGVATLPSVGVIAGPEVTPACLSDVVGTGAVVVKPARGSKGRGVTGFASAADAAVALRERRPLRAGEVDHLVVQPRADGWGRDWRVVVAGTSAGLAAVAVTRRTAPPGALVTNAPGYRVDDVDDDVAPEVVDVACRAARALGLAFCSVDVIEHAGQATVLEVNAWPGLAVEARRATLAAHLVAAARGEAR